MLEDPAGMRDAAVAWQNLGGLLDAEARVPPAVAGRAGRRLAIRGRERFAERGAAAVARWSPWSEIATARAAELADLAVVVAGAKLRMQWIWDDFTRAAGAIAARPRRLGRPDGDRPGRGGDRPGGGALVAGDLEDNLRRYTRQALDEVVDPLATRFAESALTFAAPGPVFAGPTDAVVPGDAALAALVTGAWLPDGVGLPGGPAAPRIPMAPAAPVPGAAVRPYPRAGTAPSMPPCPRPRCCLPDPRRRACRPQALPHPSRLAPRRHRRPSRWMPAPVQGRRRGCHTISGRTPFHRAVRAGR